MKALLCTHHLDTWSGSELVILELAEALHDAGWAIDIFAPHSKDDFAKQVIGERFNWHSTSCDLVTKFDYDLVYSQHNVHSYFLPDIDLNRSSGKAPLFLFGHLSPFEKFEAPFTQSERIIADIVIANSPETANSLSHLGAPFDDVIVVPNPAPQLFESARRKRTPGALRNLLVVSNHLPIEVTEALAQLECNGVSVERVGLPDNSQRLSTIDLCKADAVLTIGKTVQYAFRAGCPVFNYDRFGGAGWLTPKNVERAERTNFSGRDNAGEWEVSTIRDELSKIPAEAIEVVANCPARFKLEYWIRKLIDLCKSDRVSRLSELNRQSLLLERNAMLHIDYFYLEMRQVRQTMFKTIKLNKNLQQQISDLNKVA